MCGKTPSHILKHTGIRSSNLNGVVLSLLGIILLLLHISVGKEHIADGQPWVPQGPQTLASPGFQHPPSARRSGLTLYLGLFTRKCLAPSRWLSAPSTCPETSQQFSEKSCVLKTHTWKHYVIYIFIRIEIIHCFYYNGIAIIMTFVGPLSASDQWIREETR